MRRTGTARRMLNLSCWLVLLTAGALALDADGDGLEDAVEGWPPAPQQTNRYLVDSDGDGLTDGQEDANHNGQRDSGETSPVLADSDGDGPEDGHERLLGASNPLDPASPGFFHDADGDLLEDSLDPDPSRRDTDGDGYADGYEAVVLGLLAVFLADQHPALGDVTRDGVVSNVDALAIQTLFMGMVPPTALATTNADPTRDGQVSNVDALLVQSFFLSLQAQLPLLGPPPPTRTPTATPTPVPPTPTRTFTRTATPVTPSASLIRNGGFEEGPGQYPGVGLYWETNDAQPHPEICSLDGSTRVSGTYSQKLAAHSEWDRGAVRQVSAYGSVQGGATYELRAWVKTSGIANPAGWYLIGIWWFQDDTWLGDVKNPPQNPLNHDWREIVFRGTAPANANRAGVLLTRHTDGTVWYDDISLQRVAP